LGQRIPAADPPVSNLKSRDVAFCSRPQFERELSGPAMHARRLPRAVLIEREETTTRRNARQVENLGAIDGKYRCTCGRFRKPIDDGALRLRIAIAWSATVLSQRMCLLSADGSWKELRVVGNG
jgi:hypothetical protein